MRVRSLRHTGPGRVAVVETDLPALGEHDLLIESHCSAISPGTESMIFRGLFPKALPQDQVIKSLQGGFHYPFAYGYALGGRVVEAGPGADPAWVGRRVFAFHPHCDYAVAHEADCVLIPDDVPTLAAVLLPNVESALTFVLDASPRIGEKIMVFGQGVVGLLTTALLADFPLTRLLTADPVAYRRERSLAMGAQRALDPSDPDQWQTLTGGLFADGDGLDVAIELSGNMDALNQAIELTGFSGRIVVGSWYGTQGVPLDLGSHFHRRRQRLMSSQVSTLNPDLSGRWDKSRRIETAWEAVRKIEPHRLITHTFDITECQGAFERVSGVRDNVLQAIFHYR